jgi:hypothetical protein
VQARLKTLGAEVSSLVSDRAKALIKLAHTGLDCLSIPDVFHLSHDLARAEASHPVGVKVQQAQAVVETHQAEVECWQAVRSAYRTHLAHLSLMLHPWSLLDSTRQTSTEVERRLKVEVTALETLMATHGLPAKNDTLTKVRKQLAGLSALVDLWWQTVEHDWEDMALTSSWKDWVDKCLLPLLYWPEQLSRTRCPGQKAQIALALKVIQEAFERHPCTGRLRGSVASFHLRRIWGMISR